VKQKLQVAFAGAAHPGVFILRRDSGKSRIMLNELEMAEHLRKSRGFRVVDVTTHSVPQILAACAGAQVVAGIEGSQLMHGLMVLPRGASMLTMQPPQRFSPTFKVTTDMMDQNYSFVVGRPAQEGFTVDPDEVERTLDLLPLTAG
jgi:capsular polysaccharide biosynthesis protein